MTYNVFGGTLSLTQSINTNLGLWGRIRNFRFGDVDVSFLPFFSHTFPFLFLLSLPSIHPFLLSSPSLPLPLSQGASPNLARSLTKGVWCSLSCK